MALDVLLLLACAYFAGRTIWDLAVLPLSGWGFPQGLLVLIVLFLLALGGFEAVRITKQLRQKRAAKKAGGTLPPPEAGTTPEAARQDAANTAQ